MTESGAVCAQMEEHRPEQKCTVLHCTDLHGTDMHCTALYCTALHCTALHCTALHCTALHFTALHYTALHCAALHCIALHCTALHCTKHESCDPAVSACYHTTRHNSVITCDWVATSHVRPVEGWQQPRHIVLTAKSEKANTFVFFNFLHIFRQTLQIFCNILIYELEN